MREVRELIWHCSATRAGQHVTVADIDKMHRRRGWSGIGYHKVVYLDGSVHAGRPLDIKGAHVKNRNTGTLGYCYIGGVLSDGVTPHDTRTLAQKKTMARLTREAVEQYGIKVVSGHNQYSTKACPSFDVKEDRSLQSPTIKERTTLWSLIKRLFGVGTGGPSDTGGSPSTSSSSQQSLLSYQRMRLRQTSRFRRDTSR